MTKCQAEELERELRDLIFGRPKLASDLPALLLSVGVCLDGLRALQAVVGLLEFGSEAAQLLAEPRGRGRRGLVRRGALSHDVGTSIPAAQRHQPDAVRLY